MFCEHCGNEINTAHKFCTKCGRSVIDEIKKDPIIKQEVGVTVRSEKWWHRFFKVIYIILYLFLLIIIPLVWDANNSSYTGYTNAYGGIYEDTNDKALWHSLLTLIVYLVIIRLIKFTYLYIVFGKKPEWKKEFKRL